MTSLLGEEIAGRHRSWTSPPIKLEGMDVPKATELDNLAHQNSAYQCACVVDYMKGQREFDHVYHSQVMSAARLESSKMKGVQS